MKIAITEWNGRIAPVFDVTGQVMLLEVDAGRFVQEKCIALSGENVQNKLQYLREQGVEQLICGAISCPAQVEAEYLGMKVYGFIAGNYQEVVAAWQNNLLEQEKYAMPGCRRHRNCCRRGRKMSNRA